MNDYTTLRDTLTTLGLDHVSQGHDAAIERVVQKLDEVFGLHVMAMKEVNSEFEASMILKELELLWKNVAGALQEVSETNPFSRANWAKARLTVRPRKRATPAATE
jgi:hypothetical protein